MRIVALLATVAFVFVGALVGARVLLLARRTRKLPELYVGGSLFLYAAVAQPLIVDGRNLYEPEHLHGLGFTYCSIGRSTLRPEA